jgi:hypothetical protein
MKRFVEITQLVRQIWSLRNGHLGPSGEPEYEDLKIDRLTVPRYVRWGLRRKGKDPDALEPQDLREWESRFCRSIKQARTRIESASSTAADLTGGASSSSSVFFRWISSRRDMYNPSAYEHA